MRLSSLLAICLLAGTTLAEPAPAERVSPDWREQIIYFVLIDRFDDGEPGNNDQGHGEHDPLDHRRYSGGDLVGLKRRLDYIRGLGATALWISPPVRHMWWDGSRGYGGYHGYWAEHFMRVDPHFGSLDDYRALARGLHQRDMVLIQDIVLNHVGNYFEYPDGWDPEDPTRHFRMNPDPRPSTRPSQAPFHLNDVRDPLQREAGIYHWTPEIADYTDREQELNWQLAELDDLNTANPAVRRALRLSYAHWIREVGVDAFRVDTALHVPAEFLADFLHSGDPEAPGMLEVARRSGRDDFHAFGEGFAIDAPYEQRQAERIEAYQSGARPPLTGMLNFPLYAALGEVFARGRPTAVLGHRIEAMQAVHARLNWMPSFIDNRDVDRFLAASDEQGLRQALLAMMTLPGIPVIYYGTEQGFRERRAAMFAAGWGSEGRDHFDSESSLYRLIAGLSALRRSSPAFTHGQVRRLRDSAAGPGALAWLMQAGDAQRLVVFNTAGHEVLLDALDTGLSSDWQWQGVYALDGSPPTLVPDASGRIQLRLPPRSGQVWAPLPLPQRAPVPERPAPKLDPLPAEVVTGQLAVTGTGPDHAPLWLLLDGNLDTATSLSLDADGRFEAVVDLSGRVDPEAVHRLLLWSEASGQVSAAQSLRVRPQWRLLATVDDPPGDDHGPEGRYLYPADPVWTALRPGDLRGARLYGAPGALRLDLQMSAISQGWNPPNGFDRVALLVHLSLPGHEQGARALPLQNTQMPDSRRWQLRSRIGGWSNLLFAADGADAGSEGRPLAAVPRIEVDTAARRIRIEWSGEALRGFDDAAGLLVHVSTWDQDGMLRPLLPEPTPNAFGGGDGRRDPLWLDELILHVP